GLYARAAEVVEAMASVRTVVFDKTGTLSRPELVQLLWHGEPLGPGAAAAVVAVVAGSAHPLSRALADALPSCGELPPVEEFTERPGLGIAGRSAGHEVALGSAGWLRQRGIALGGDDSDGDVLLAVD